jgi:hypothetical protein
MKAEATHGRRKKSLKQQIHPEAIKKKYKNIHGIVTGKGQTITTDRLTACTNARLVFYGNIYALIYIIIIIINIFDNRFYFLFWFIILYNT